MRLSILFLCAALMALTSGFAKGRDVSAVQYNETYRPQFHFTSASNWLNDPNGLVYYRGEYHLFFQHNPSGIDWGNMTWGHAVSRDLVHWKQLEDAIKPDALGTVFSGSAAVDWHNTAGFGAGKQPALVAIFTAAGGTSPESRGQMFSQCIAYSTDSGRTFARYEHNPVLPHIKAENRDPKLVWYEPAKSWVLALYLDGDEYGLFTSADMKRWKQIQTLPMPGSSECPDFFPMKVQGEQTVKWVFTGANGRYMVGDFNGDHFQPDGPPNQADYGSNYYAVQTYSDIPASDGRRIQIAWMNGGKYPGMPFNQQMSFPCQLTLRRTPEGLRLYRQPVNEIKSIESAPVRIGPVTALPNHNILESVKSPGDTLDLNLEIEPGEAASVALNIRGETIRYDGGRHTVTMLGKTAPISPVDGRLALRLLVDRASLELFGNGGAVSMTSCFLPAPDNHELALSVEGGPAKVRKLEIRSIRSAWAGGHERD